MKLSEEFVDDKGQRKVLRLLGVEDHVWDDIRKNNDGLETWKMFLMLLSYWVKKCNGSKDKLEAHLKTLRLI